MRRVYNSVVSSSSVRMFGHGVARQELDTERMNRAMYGF